MWKDCGFDGIRSPNGIYFYDTNQMSHEKTIKIYNIIVEKLFSDIFKSIEITFKGLEFVNLTLRVTKSKQFERCKFLDIRGRSQNAGRY